MGGVAMKAAHLSEGHPLKDSIISAAEHHDLGKSDPRFQSMLYGDPIMASSGPLLAKSGMRSSSQMLASYYGSGLPRGFRHELASVVLLEEAGIETPEELVKYLVATHHGFGRPWFPVVRDDSDLGIQMGTERTFQVNRYATLQEKYGPWKLAGLELLIRAADARESIMEQTNR
jgi:CRISPR-associated endonuclease/helicase Cas3